MLLKNDAISTILAHNADKQPQKRKSSVLRKYARAKRQLCKNALIHQELVDSFEFECNTKETQTEIALEILSDFQFEIPTAKFAELECNAALKSLRNNHHAN